MVSIGNAFRSAPLQPRFQYKYNIASISHRPALLPFCSQVLVLQYWLDSGGSEVRMQVKCFLSSTALPIECLLSHRKINRVRASGRLSKLYVILDLTKLEQQARLKDGLMKYCQKAYNRVLDKPTTEPREPGICMRENPFYANTVRSFRDRRCGYKELNKVLKGKLSESKSSCNSIKIQETQDMIVIYDSLQLACKCILNSCGYVMRKSLKKERKKSSLYLTILVIRTAHPAPVPGTVTVLNMDPVSDAGLVQDMDTVQVAEVGTVRMRQLRMVQAMAAGGHGYGTRYWIVMKNHKYLALLVFVHARKI